MAFTRQPLLTSFPANPCSTTRQPCSRLSPAHVFPPAIASPDRTVKTLRGASKLAQDEDAVVGLLAGDVLVRDLEQAARFELHTLQTRVGQVRIGRFQHKAQGARTRFMPSRVEVTKQTSAAAYSAQSSSKLTDLFKKWMGIKSVVPVATPIKNNPHECLHNTAHGCAGPARSPVFRPRVCSPRPSARLNTSVVQARPFANLHTSGVLAPPVRPS